MVLYTAGDRDCNELANRYNKQEQRIRRRKMMWTIMGWIAVGLTAISTLILIGNDKAQGGNRIAVVIADGIIIAYILHSLLAS